MLKQNECKYWLTNISVVYGVDEVPHSTRGLLNDFNEESKKEEADDDFVRDIIDFPIMLESLK